MLWHTVIFDARNADMQQREQLKDAVRALAGIDEVLWLQDGSETGDESIGFLSIFRDAEALAAYREAPLHLALVQVIRNSGVTVHRLNFEGPPPPA